MSPRARRFYARVMDAAERGELDDALEVEGVEEEIAILRVQLRRIIEESPEDRRAIETVTRLLLAALTTQRQLTGRQAETLSEHVTALFERLMEVVRTPGGAS